MIIEPFQVYQTHCPIVGGEVLEQRGDTFVFGTKPCTSTNRHTQLSSKTASSRPAFNKTSFPARPLQQDQLSTRPDSTRPASLKTVCFFFLDSKTVCFLFGLQDFVVVIFGLQDCLLFFFGTKTFTVITNPTVLIRVGGYTFTN